MIELYPHQKDLINRTRQAFTRNREVCMVSPTGSGKTIMSSYITLSAYQKSRIVWVIVPRRQLVRQTSNTFKNIGIPHSFVCAGYPFEPNAPVYIATPQSLVKKLDGTRWADLLIVDEFHYGQTFTNKLVNENKARGSFLLGLTATPIKGDGTGLGKWVNELVVGTSVADLMEMGFLSRYRAFAPAVPDLSGIKVVAGDYAKDALAQRMIDLQGALVSNASKFWLKYAKGLKTVIFAVDIEHSKRTATAFNDSGVRCVHMDGETPDEARKQIISDLADGRIDAISNCGLMTFGFDLSAQVGRNVPLDCMVDLRPTKSLPLQKQKEGRVLRAKPNPAILLDCANNILTHGYPDDQILWSLEGFSYQGKREKQKPDIIRCCSCGTLHKRAPSCPECGYQHPYEGRDIEEVEAELAEVAREQARLKKKQEVWQAQTLEGLIELAKTRGYKESWAHHVWLARQKKVKI